tara:strand:- start:18 stop:461 length:444 start_codon:yes stop_codon:yes gene_type:complete
MALTYRTGSGGKGSALTIEELDNNFRHFTGSHPIDGDLIITGSITVSGSANSVFDIDFYDLQITGGLDVSRDVVVRDDLTVYDDFVASGSDNIIGNSAGNALLQVTGSFSSTGSVSFTDLPTTEPVISGQLWLSGSFSNSKYLMVRD